MSAKFKIVDLFAGPGGLAEGFASVRDEKGQRVFEIVLSVEKEPSAFATLRLRSFFRQFDQAPQAYYDYIAGRISKEEMIEHYPAEWDAAVAETVMLELGTDMAASALDPIVDALSDTSDETLLIGGPPCQAYSLVGRARNKGIKNYDATTDHRHFLYKEYIRIINRLKPAVFVMENVKGILSSKVGGQLIFGKILSDLKAAGGEPDSYVLFPLTPNAIDDNSGFIIRSEDFGIPQSRHRVIIVGIRADLAASADRLTLSSPALQSVQTPSTVASVLGGMPRLRSGLSKAKDGDEEWAVAVVNAFEVAAAACLNEGEQLADVAKVLQQNSLQLTSTFNFLTRKSTDVTQVKDSALASWLGDEKLTHLSNNATRGHMESDLARYAFVSTFAQVRDRSPKAGEVPIGLAPVHANWTTGKFADRFRAQRWNAPSTTITSHISKDGHYFIHPDPLQCRSLTVREAARLQTFPDNYFFEGNRTEQFVQVGNAVPPLLAAKIANIINGLLRR